MKMKYLKVPKAIYDQVMALAEEEYRTPGQQIAFMMKRYQESEQHHTGEPQIRLPEDTSELTERQPRKKQPGKSTKGETGPPKYMRKKGLEWKILNMLTAQQSRKGRKADGLTKREICKKLGDWYSDPSLKTARVSSALRRLHRYGFVFAAKGTDLYMASESGINFVKQNERQAD